MGFSMKAWFFEEEYDNSRYCRLDLGAKTFANLIMQDVFYTNPRSYNNISPYRIGFYDGLGVSILLSSIDALCLARKLFWNLADNHALNTQYDKQFYNILKWLDENCESTAERLRSETINREVKTWKETMKEMGVSV